MADFIDAYIDEKLGFYFDGGFQQMKVDGQFDADDLVKWASLAVLFDQCVDPNNTLSLEEKERGFCLVEALYTKMEVDQLMGEGDDDALETMLGAYQIKPDDFPGAIGKGTQIIREHGLDLTKLIPRESGPPKH